MAGHFGPHFEPLCLGFLPQLLPPTCQRCLTQRGRKQSGETKTPSKSAKVLLQSLLPPHSLNQLERLLVATDVDRPRNTVSNFLKPNCIRFRDSRPALAHGFCALHEGLLGQREGLTTSERSVHGTATGPKGHSGGSSNRPPIRLTVSWLSHSSAV